MDRHFWGVLGGADQHRHKAKQRRDDKPHWRRHGKRSQGNDSYQHYEPIHSLSTATEARRATSPHIHALDQSRGNPHFQTSKLLPRRRERNSKCSLPAGNVSSRTPGEDCWLDLGRGQMRGERPGEARRAAQSQEVVVMSRDRGAKKCRARMNRSTQSEKYRRNAG